MNKAVFIPSAEANGFSTDLNIFITSALKNIKVPDIEHLWVLLNPSLDIDKQKPLKLTGVLYEYAHKNVRNIGMRVVGINQG